MVTILEQMLKHYNTTTLEDKKNALKEIAQEITLCGLSRAGFFKHAAFYGGTALRIFYGLDRFSEDLDFSLLSPNDNFELSAYFSGLEKEFASLGLEFEIEKKEKKVNSPIKSAFLKGNTKVHMLNIYGLSEAKISNNDIIKIKLEIDTNPPNYANFENKYKLLPSPYQVKLYDMPSLFAGKLHAVIGRNWKNRVKGRDLYDYIFYISQKTKINLPHLQARLEESKDLPKNEIFSIDTLISMLKERFAKINYEQAKQDVLPFIEDKSKLNLWSEDFFISITDDLKKINK